YAPAMTIKQEEKLKEALTAATRAIAGRRDVQVSFDRNQSHYGLQSDPRVALPPLNSLQTRQEIRELRGAADLAALSLRYHNPKLHRHHRPAEQRSAEIYDRMELMRVELLG